MTATPRILLDDCFLTDSERMRHDDVLALLRERLDCVVGTETVALADAAGRTLAEDIVAKRDVPLTDNAAVDGYAFAHADYLAANGRLELSGRVAAGDLPSEAAPGTGTRIFTGASMPPGTDTVAMQEDCTVEGALITVPPGLKPGANRRRAGEDVGAGETIMQEGQTLRPAGLAALASLGQPSVKVREKLALGLLSTGDEIIQPGADIRPGQVYDSNRPMLTALATSPKTEVTDLGHIGDDEKLMEQTLLAAATTCQLIITSGGASRGEEDHALNVLDRIGTRHLWQIAVKPGRPMMFGQIGDTVMIALPGNPVAAMVCFLLYVRPVIAHLTGTAEPRPAGMMLPADFAIAKRKLGRREFLRGWRHVDEATGQIRARKFERDGSGLITGLRLAEGLIEIDEDRPSVENGALVRFVPFADMDF